MSEPQVHVIEFAVDVRVAACTYKGEPWFQAQGALNGWSDIGYGRTVERAVSFLLEKYVQHLRDGYIEIRPTPHNDPGVVMELADNIYERKKP